MSKLMVKIWMKLTQGIVSDLVNQFELASLSQHIGCIIHFI